MGASKISNRFLSLLGSGSAPDAAWANLGEWSHASSYEEAGRALAWKLGQAARLRPGACVLDLASGYGASLYLWRSEWQVGPLWALEADHSRRVSLQYLGLEGFELLAEKTVQDLWRAPAEPLYDAIIAVDAAYHFPDARDFLSDCKKRLRADGRLSFSTLIKTPSWSSQPLWIKGLTFIFSAAAGMPRASLLSATQWETLACEEAWPGFRITPAAVLEGFSQYIRRRSSALSLRQKLTADWIKISVTARWAEFLARRDILSYVIIAASKSSDA